MYNYSNNYHCKLKIYIPLFKGELYKNQLCIAHKRFMYLSLEEKYKKINYYNKLKIFALHFQEKVHKNQLIYQKLEIFISH